MLFKIGVVLCSLTQPSLAERANEIDGFHEIFKKPNIAFYPSYDY